MRQGARSDLRLIEIWREVHIGRTDESRQLIRRHKAVFKCHMIRHTQPIRQILKAVAIGLALALKQIWMRCAEDDVQHLGMPANDLRHGANRMLNAFSRTKQTIGQKHRTPLQIKIILEHITGFKLHIGNAVRNNVDHRILHPMIGG